MSIVQISMVPMVVHPWYLGQVPKLTSKKISSLFPMMMSFRARERSVKEIRIVLTIWDKKCGRMRVSFMVLAMSYNKNSIEDAMEEFFRAAKLGGDPSALLRQAGVPVGLKVQPSLSTTSSNDAESCRISVPHVMPMRLYRSKQCILQHLLLLTMIQVWFRFEEFRSGVYMCGPPHDLPEEKYKVS